MRRSLLLFCLLLLFGLQTTTLQAAGIPLASMNHTLLADFLARSEWLLGWDNNTRYVDIYRISEGALACADTLESCPRQRLFIRIQIPDHSVEGFILPPSFGWHNPKEVYWTRGPPELTIIEVQELVAGKNPAIRRFDTKTRRIFLSESKAYVQ